MAILKKSVTLQPGESKVVAFTYTPSQPRTYQVTVDSLVGSFVATGPSEPSFVVSDLIIDPLEVEVGQPVSIAVVVANVGGTAGTYEVICEVL